jgi:hypothetical protein
MMFTLLNAWTATLAVIAAIEQPRMDRITAAAEHVEPGENEEQVLAALGPPDVQWAERSGFTLVLFGRMPRQWSYGTILDAENLIDAETGWPNPLPIKLRLFGPDSRDVIVTWRDDGTVASVDRPQPPPH